VWEGEEHGGCHVVLYRGFPGADSAESFWVDVSGGVWAEVDEVVGESVGDRAGVPEGKSLALPPSLPPSIPFCTKIGIN